MNKQDIHAMKENREVFMFWPEEWQNWARKNWKEFQYCDRDHKIDSCLFPHVAYQLRADYELPDERWYFHDRSQALEQAYGDGSAFEDNGWIEVPANDLEYVRECLKRDDIGEYELKWHEGEYDGWLLAGHYCGMETYKKLVFVRKNKKAGWKEYEIKKENGILVVDGLVCGYTPLYEAIAYATNRGLCPQFAYKVWPGWHTMPNLTSNDKPATPVKMRVWEGVAQRKVELPETTKEIKS